MKQKAVPIKQPAEDVIRDIRRATRLHFSAEEKIRIVLDGLRGEENISEICRREGNARALPQALRDLDGFCDTNVTIPHELPAKFRTSPFGRVTRTVLRLFLLLSRNDSNQSGSHRCHGPENWR